MDSLQHLRSAIECSWSWLCEFIEQNKLTASLIATNAALITWYVYWKNTRSMRLLNKIPGIKGGYPLVGDILSFSPDPCGEYVCTWSVFTSIFDTTNIALYPFKIPSSLLYLGLHYTIEFDCRHHFPTSSNVHLHVIQMYFRGGPSKKDLTLVIGYQRCEINICVQLIHRLCPRLAYTAYDRLYYKPSLDRVGSSFSTLVQDLVF